MTPPLSYKTEVAPTKGSHIHTQTSKLEAGHDCTEPLGTARIPLPAHHMTWHPDSPWKVEPQSTQCIQNTECKRELLVSSPNRYLYKCATRKLNDAHMWKRTWFGSFSRAFLRHMWNRGVVPVVRSSVRLSVCLWSSNQFGYRVTWTAASSCMIGVQWVEGWWIEVYVCTQVLGWQQIDKLCYIGRYQRGQRANWYHIKKWVIPCRLLSLS